MKVGKAAGIMSEIWPCFRERSVGVANLIIIIISAPSGLQVPSQSGLASAIRTATATKVPQADNSEVILSERPPADLHLPSGPPLLPPFCAPTAKT